MSLFTSNFIDLPHPMSGYMLRCAQREILWSRRDLAGRLCRGYFFDLGPVDHPGVHRPDLLALSDPSDIPEDCAHDHTRDEYQTAAQQYPALFKNRKISHIASNIA